MDITMTDNALVKLRELLAKKHSKYARIRVSMNSSGCVCGCRKDFELKLSIDTKADPQHDRIFELYGLPFVVNAEQAASCPPGRRLGLAALPR